MSEDSGINPPTNNPNENWEQLAGNYHGMHDALKPHIERLLSERGIDIPAPEAAPSGVTTVPEDLRLILERSLESDDIDPTHIFDSFLIAPGSPLPGTAKVVTEILNQTCLPFRVPKSGYATEIKYNLLATKHDNLISALSQNPDILLATADYALEGTDDWQKLMVSNALTSINELKRDKIPRDGSISDYIQRTKETPTAVNDLDLNEAYQTLTMGIKPATVSRILHWRSKSLLEGDQDYIEQAISVREAAIFGACMEDDLMAYVSPTADEVRSFNVQYQQVGSNTRTVLDKGFYNHEIVIRADHLLEKVKADDCEGKFGNMAVSRIFGVICRGDNEDMQNLDKRISLLESITEQGCDPVDAAQILDLSRTNGLDELAYLMDSTQQSPAKQNEILSAVAIMARRKELFLPSVRISFYDRVDYFGYLLGQAYPYFAYPDVTACAGIEKLKIMDAKLDAIIQAGVNIILDRERGFIADAAFTHSLNENDYNNQLDAMIAFGESADIIIRNSLLMNVAASAIGADPQLNITLLKELINNLELAIDTLPTYFQNAVNSLVNQKAAKGLTLDSVQEIIGHCNQLKNPELLLENLKTVIPIEDVFRTAKNALPSLGQEDKLQEVLEFVIAQGEYESLVSSNAYAEFDGIYAQQIADLAVTAGDFVALKQIEQKYRLPPTSEQLHSVDSLMLYRDNKEYALYVEQVKNLPPLNQPETVRKVVEVFGNYFSVNGARQIATILGASGSPNPNETDLVQTSGEAGMEELRAKVSGFANQLKTVELSDQTLAQALKYPLLLDVMMRSTRFEQSTFGSHGSDQLRQLIEYYQMAQRDGRIQELSSNYQPSKVLEVSLLNAQKERPKFTEDVVERYAILKSEFQVALYELRKPRAFTKMFDDLRSKVIKIAEGLETTIVTGKATTGEELSQLAIENMVARKESLRQLTDLKAQNNPHSYELRSLKNFEQNFAILARHGELHSLMRTLTFAWAVRKNPGWKTILPLLNTSENLTVDDISTTREFIEHVTNQETFREYFVNKKNANLFKNMTSTKALEEALSRAQNVGISKNSAKVQFVPTRGVFMELSGHIADACWASRYNSIAETMPNMTAVIIKRNPGDPLKEKLVGAGMLIETTASDGSPVLLIRGLNPLEDFINRTSVESFYETFTSYARNIAHANGRKLAIVIDDHAGGSATNRPALFNFLTGLKRSLSQVEVNSDDTFFNNYDVSKYAYLV